MIDNDIKTEISQQTEHEFCLFLEHVSKLLHLTFYLQKIVLAVLGAYYARECSIPTPFSRVDPTENQLR